MKDFHKLSQLLFATLHTEGMAKAKYGVASPEIVRTHESLLAEGLLVLSHDETVRTSPEGVALLRAHLNEYIRDLILTPNQNEEA